MVVMLLWLVLFVLCWPLALVALFFPVVWLLLWPVRFLAHVGFTILGWTLAFVGTVATLVLLPLRLLRHIRRAPVPSKA